MNTRALALTLATLALATTPLVAGEYTYSGTLNATATGVLVTSANDFKFSAAPGDVITVTLTWMDTAQDLDVRVIPPGGSCALTPEPDAACLAGSVNRRIDNAACADRRPITAANGAESATFTATTAGVHTVAVMAMIAPGSTDYSISIAVNGATPVVTGPTAITYVGNSPVCKLP